MRLERYNEGLAGEAAARTSELVQRQQEVGQARDAADAPTCQGRLPGQHEPICTPMNTIIDLYHLLALDATDAQQQDRLAKVDQAAQNLLQVINDVLDLSKSRQSGLGRGHLTDG